MAAFAKSWGEVTVHPPPARNPLVPLRSTEIPFHHPLGMRCSSSGVGAIIAVQGYDRVPGSDADPHENISHNGSSGFGGNAVVVRRLI
jgi:hypothetical protein